MFDWCWCHGPEGDKIRRLVARKQRLESEIRKLSDADAHFREETATRIRAALPKQGDGSHA